LAALYLFCLIVGGGLLLVSLLGPDADAHPDTSLDLDADVDVSTDMDGHPLEFGHGASWGLAKEFFSIRGLFYFLAGFGATGLLLETVTAASTVVAVIVALLTGLLAAVAAGAVYGLARRSESGLVPEGHEHLVGLPAQVVLPVVAGRRGKVRFLHSGREIELLARLYGADDPDCSRGTTVVIVDIEGDTALVTPAPSLPSDLP
jgi:membrane protein implicated in regulation of membrane protease activity